MIHDNAMPLTSSCLGKSAVAGPSGAVSTPSSSLDGQRRAIQRQVEALRQAGALPSAAGAAQRASAVQWNNWSNG